MSLIPKYVGPGEDGPEVREVATPLAAFAGNPDDPNRGVRYCDLPAVPGAQPQLVEIEAGGRVGFHDIPVPVLIVILRGRGKLGLPDGCETPFQAPDLFVFEPGSPHDWHDIEEPVLFAVSVAGELE